MMGGHLCEIKTTTDSYLETVGTEKRVVVYLRDPRWAPNFSQTLARTQPKNPAQFTNFGYHQPVTDIV